MAINKVVFGNEVKMDLTNDTVSADNLLEGETAHDRSGSPIVGTAKQGHSILDRLGTLLTQRSKLKFGGMLKTTDDATNGVTEVSDLAEEIDWSVWNAMTEAQRTAYSAGKKIDIVNVPSVSGSIPVELIKTLWKNPSPTANFVEQTITLNSDDYDLLLITAYLTKTYKDSLSVIAKKGENAYITFADVNSSSGVAINSYRRFNYYSDTEIYISHAYLGGDSRTVNDGGLIPAAIYGIKFSVNVDMSALVANVSTSASKCMLSDGETSVEDAIDGNWVLIDSAIGLNTISFASVLNKARELLVVTEYSQGRFYKIIPYRTITRGYYDIYDGMYASASNNANATWTVNNSTSVISLKSVFWGSTNVTADCTTLVYYR